MMKIVKLLIAYEYIININLIKCRIILKYYWYIICSETLNFWSEIEFKVHVKLAHPCLFE